MAMPPVTIKIYKFYGKTDNGVAQRKNKTDKTFQFSKLL